MTKLYSQQELLEKIVSFSKEIFERQLELNPLAILYDAEKLSHSSCWQTPKFKCHIHRYGEKNPYYEIWFDTFYDINPGFNEGFLVISNAYGKANFYINDGDYGRVNNYDEEKINECFLVILDVFSKFEFIKR